MSIKALIDAKKQNLKNEVNLLVDTLYDGLKSAIMTSNIEHPFYIYIKEPCSKETLMKYNDAAHKLLERLRMEDVSAELGVFTSDGRYDNYYIEIL